MRIINLIFAFCFLTLPIFAANQDDLQKNLQDGAKKYLINLISFDTSQPEPKEINAVRYIYTILNKNKIDWDIYRPQKNRANLIARLNSPLAEKDKKPALLLISHLDTAPPAEGSTFPPFRATEKNGNIYGLRATDAKNYTAVYLALLIWLKEQNITPKRDIILLVTSGEESGSDTGLKWLGETHWDKINPGYALNEGGGIIKNTPQNIPLVFAEAGTKMYMDLKITASGEAAHSSVPVEHNAVYRLSSDGKTQ